MEWHQSNSNGAIASPHGQQYLLPSTSSMVANGQSQSPSIQQNSIVHSGSFNSNKDPLLQNLLKAKTDEDFFNIHQAALGKFRSSKPNRPTNQLQSNLHISSYKPTQDLVPIPDNRSTIAVQNTVGSNYRMPTYVNTVHQTSQQPPSVAVGQHLGGNGYNATAVQQPLQNSQALQNFQPTVTYSYPQQNLFNSVRPPANTAQMPAQQMARNMLSSKRYMLQTDSASKKLPAETNISVPNQDCRNVQNITGPSLANYRLLAPKILLHASQQQMNGLQTVPQLDGNANYYTQRQNLQNVMVNNSPQMSSAAPTTMLPTYSQAVPNSQNCFNASVNQNFSKQMQNYAAPNVQQPAQTSNPLPVQSSVGDEQSRVNELIASHTRKRELLKLFLVYRDVRQKYELLNQENNLLRLRLQANTSQDNAGPPPLLSNLPTTQPQANSVIAGKQNITQALPVQNSAQINSASSFHSQHVYDNPANAANQAGIQPNLSLQENAAVLNPMFISDTGNYLRQNNYSVFDGGQSNVTTGSSSSLQSLSSETLKTSREFRGQTISSNQYASSPNSNTGIELQNRHGLHSLDKPSSVTQIPNPACLEKDGYEHLSSHTTGLTENEQVISVSREAIEASLPLWKTVPQSSSQSTNRSLETQQNQSQVDSSLADFRLDEITSGPTHEVSSTIPVPKQDLAIPNQANPQIAIVSPLVQSKEVFHENYKLPKCHLEDMDVENTTINGLINPRESECFNNILRELESLAANTTNNNIEAPRSKELPVSSQDNVDSSLPSRIPALSQTELEASSENVEIDGLQISGICTLVEGNSLYDSSIAMMFDETLNTRDDHSKTVDTSCISKAPGSTSPKAVTIAIKSEPVDEVPPLTDQVPPMIEADLHCNRISCNDMQADKCMVSPQQESCCDLESSAISDQLTELLTEFPYGIKNYMSEDILESANGPSGKTTDKPVLKASAAPEDFKPVNCGQASAAPEDFKPVNCGQASAAPEDFKAVDHDQAIHKTQTEIVPSPSVNLQHVVETDSETLMDLGPPAEKLSAEVEQTERVSKLAEDADGDAIQVMDTCSDDGFEILSNSPVSNIHITLLDQDEIPKIFPDQNEHVGSEKCNETELGGLQNCANTVEAETESNLLKDSSDVTDAGTDKNLFCCLFSWINLTNKNAPKCNCKQLESTKVESTQLLCTNTVNTYSIIKTEPSPERPGATLKGLPNPTNSCIIGLQILQPTDRPPKLDLIDSDNEEIKQPLDKPPKLERILSEPKHVQESSLDFTPQAESGLNRSTSLDNIQTVRDCLMKNKPVIQEKSLTSSSPETGEPTFRKREGQSPNKFKAHGSRKSEKLIVKTDFLKNKHPYKKKRKGEEKNGANIQGTSNKSGSQSGFLNLQGKPGERARGDKKIEQNVSAKKAELSPDQQADKSWKRQKSPGVDRSSHSRGVKRHKEKESHFEKTRKVPSVQEYLERKRELCKKRSETRTEPSESLGDLRHTAKKPSEMSGDSHLALKRPLSPAKTNVTLKENRRSETPKDFNRKDRSQSREPYEAGHQKRKESHKGQRVPENKTQNLKRSSSKDKIYLSPCVGSRRASYEGINLAKLQIRHSPDKPKHIERRRSIESSCHPKHSNSDLKTINTPKMLEFKLYPEFAHRSPTTQDKSMEATDPKSKNVVEGIKSSKEAWCNSIPFKKRKVESIEDQGFQKSPSSAGSTLTYKPLEKNAARPPQDSRTTFNVFKQMYHEKRSKSLDCSQGNS